MIITTIITTTIQIYDRPAPALLLHLKRWTLAGKKQPAPMALSSRLDIMAPHHHHHHNTDDSYRLVGMVHHHGTSPVSGHYTAEVWHPQQNQWISFNDATATPQAKTTTTTTTRYIHAGQAQETTCYMLLYVPI